MKGGYILNPRIEKLKVEREKIAAKMESLAARLKALDEQILKLENMDIIGIVRENGLSVDRLSELMALLDKNPTAAVPTTFIETEEKEDDEE